MAFRQTDDGEFRGAVAFTGSMTMPSQTVGDAEVKTTDPIDAEKLEHQHRGVYAQESATTAADEARVVHVVVGTTGEIQAFQAGSVVACVGDDTVDVDLLKDGVSVLVAAITLDNANVAYTPEAATIDTAAVAAGDVLEVSIDATHNTGTLALGVYAVVDLFEDAD